MTVNEVETDPATGALIWAKADVLGINGRGVKRPGRTEQIGSGKNATTVTIGEDVTNQVSAQADK